MNRREEALIRVNRMVVKAESDYRRALERTKRTKPRDGFIYFVGADHRRLIKIGWTGGDPRQRLRNLQTGNGGELELLTAVRGTKGEEGGLHAAFVMDVAREGARSEWFLNTARVEMLLWCLNVGGYPPPKKSRALLEARFRTQYAWLIGRQTFDEALSEACRRAISMLE